MSELHNTISKAMAYAKQGWPVFPCVPGKKTPSCNNGFKDATTDQDQIGTWFKDNNNIGVPTGKTSGLIVIDDDCYHPGGSGLKKLEANLSPLPNTYTVETRAGGKQHYFQYPPEIAHIKSSNGEIALHVDIKADGGYIIAPPSYVRADHNGKGGYYTAINQSPIAKLPQSWIDKLLSTNRQVTPSSRTSATMRAILGNPTFELPIQIGKGQRNTTLLKYAGHLRGRSIPEDIIEELLDNANKSRCNPPLGEDELTSIAGRYKALTESTPLSIDDWPEPQNVKPALPVVPALNLDILPDSLKPYIVDQSELMQAPPEYIAMPLMAAIAATLGNNWAMAPKKRDHSWLVTPILWAGIVGRPGAMKSPALDKATCFLKPLESAMNTDYQVQLQQYEMDKIAYQSMISNAKAQAKKGQPLSTLPPEPVKPQPERLIVNDTTVQKLGDILVWSPRGIFVERDELTGWLESLRADGQEEARAFYLAAWNGNKTHRIDRIGRGSTTIERTAVWLVGGIQPSKLKAYVRQAIHGGNGDDGLLQRIQLIVWPDPNIKWKKVDRHPNLKAAQDVEACFKRLRALDPSSIGATISATGGPAYLHFDSFAQDRFDEWRCHFENGLRTKDLHPALESHFAKYRSLVPALALVIHLVDCGTGAVSVESCNKAIELSLYLAAHAKRVYSAATNSSAQSAKALAEKITTGKLQDGFTARVVQRNGWSSLTTVDDVKAAIEWLEDANWLRQVIAPTAGRNKTTYIINPKAGKK